MKTILILAFMLSGCASLTCEDVINKEFEVNNKTTGINATWYASNMVGRDAQVFLKLGKSVGINPDICKLPHSEIQFVVKHEFGHLLTKGYQKYTKDGLEDQANIIAGSLYKDQGLDISEYIALSDKRCKVNGQYWCDRSYYARYGFNNYLIDYSQ